MQLISVIYPYFFLNKYAILFYSRFILLLSLFYKDHLVFIPFLIMISWVQWQYYYVFVFIPYYSVILYTWILFLIIIICTDAFHFILHFYIRHWWRNHRFRNYEICVSIISNDVILMLFYPHIFEFVMKARIYAFLVYFEFH